VSSVRLRHQRPSADSIRDFIAFPKNNAGRDMMIDTPSTISQAQLDELSIAVKEIKK
jgi:aspartyl-tRNA synthetase